MSKRKGERVALMFIYTEKSTVKYGFYEHACKENLPLKMDPHSLSLLSFFLFKLAVKKFACNKQI